MENPRDATLRLAKEFAKKGQPDDWFEEFYARADGDINKVYWADLEPGPHLVEYLKKNPVPEGGRAVTIGCGLGDDAECLAARGFGVTAFDISPAAIEMCQKRYPDSKVDYVTADLFEPLEGWARSFDLVYECNTIQILTGENRVRALQAMADLVKPGGVILVSCRSRNEDEGLDAWPLALDRHEIDGFARSGLVEKEFVAYDDTQDPPVPHYFAVYQRPSGLSVRTAEEKDIPELVRLWVDFMDYHADLDPLFTRLPEGADNWTRYIEGKLDEDDFGVFVAEEDGSLAGYTVAFLKEYPPIFTVKGCGFIDEMYVEPEFRGRGVGRDLFHATEKWLREKGAGHLELKVDIDNEPSRRFWESMGFEPRVEIRAKRYDSTE